jgi:hypothetical protein
MILEVEDKPAIEPASAHLIRDALRDLKRPRHKFAILKSPPRFIQTMINPDGSFVVEYSEGSVKNMFELEPLTVDDVEKVFLLFLDGGDFRNALPFRPITNR